MKAPNPYRTVLRYPGALRFSGAGVLARFELAMGTLGVVLLVTGTGGSYTLATVLTGCHALAIAVFSPLLSGLVDRHGQRRVVLPQVAVYVPALIGLILAVRYDAPVAVMIVLALAEGGSRPMVTNLVRARWSWIFRGTGELKTAFAWESMLDAAIIAVGAPLVTFLAVYLFPAAALLVAGGALGVSVLLLAAQRETEPPAARRPRSAGRPPRRVPPGVLRVAVVTCLLGANLGAFDIVALARADELGTVQLAGWILAVYAIGSAIGGTLAGRYGTLGSPPRQYVVLLAGLSLGVVPMIFLADPLWLVLLAFLAGAFIAPTIITGMTIVEAIAPVGRVTESLAWMGVGTVAGRAAGQVAAGRVVDEISASAGFILVSAFAATACVLAALSMRRLAELIPVRARFAPSQAATVRPDSR